MLSVMQYAKVHGKSRQYVHRMIRAGRLPAVQIGRGWAISADAVIMQAGKIRANIRTKQSVG